VGPASEARTDILLVHSAYDVGTGQLDGEELANRVAWKYSLGVGVLGEPMSIAYHVGFGRKSPSLPLPLGT
jgi:hypothetical protein